MRLIAQETANTELTTRLSLVEANLAELMDRAGGDRIATIAERDERIASLKKQLATTRALLYASGPRNQQGPSPSA